MKRYSREDVQCGPMNESEKQEKPVAPEYCKDCKRRISKKCTLINIYVPRKGGCLEFMRKK